MMTRRTRILRGSALVAVALTTALLGLLSAQDEPDPDRPPQQADTLPQEVIGKGESYMPVVVPDFETVYRKDVAAHDEVMARQKALLAERYDLADNRGRKKIQQGVRVKLPDGVSWEELSELTPA
jgi:hypothetical protein